ncbi:hypothetical protein LP420_02070 [Massilia sp. B-10]|nr:hypothetical protein LP420_02070 [Massilia sp. B-10]
MAWRHDLGFFRRQAEEYAATARLEQDRLEQEKIDVQRSDDADQDLGDDGHWRLLILMKP